MSFLRPLPRALSRPLSLVVVAAWVLQMGLLMRQSLFAAPVSLAADLARYGRSAHWRGVYYRGEKIGFSVSQTVPTDGGYEIQENGQLQLQLMGTPNPVRIKTLVKVDKSFKPHAFSFSLDPGTGAISVEGRLEGTRLHLDIASKAGTRSETRELKEAPNLSLSLSRRLAAEGLAPGKRFTLSTFDPATLRNAPMTIVVGPREVVTINDKPMPAFKLTTTFSGITSHSWVTETGEVVREESPTGLIVVEETRERATAIAMSSEMRGDMYRAAAVVPRPERRIDDPVSVEFLRVRLRGVDLTGPAVQGGGQSVDGEIVEVREAEFLPAGPPDADLQALLQPETFIESDAPEIVAEAESALKDTKNAKERAERLVRHVNGLLEKKPTVSLPSALEVLRTRVGDCNEHTALYVALARAAKLPSRIAVGLVHLRGAFYYHAWPEVFVEEAAGRGRWLPVDPTLNQYPADLTHIRLARGGLEQQSVVLGAMGRAQMQILDLRVKPGSTPILVGRSERDPRPPVFELPVRDGSSGTTCWSKPRP